MCCFSGRVDRVTDTRIFARGVNGRQVIVYSMAYAAPNDLAMILPLPVPAASPENAVRFIPLDGYPEFFAYVEAAFPLEALRMRVMGMELASAVQLVVHEVGDFEASFVPGLDDFERLDPRFRIPSTVWEKLPTYQDYGFAVFKLSSSTKGSLSSPAGSTRKVHPMALEFPRRHAALLYFPTLHVHDRTVQPGAGFDHLLYCQPERGWDAAVHLGAWKQSERPASSYLDVAKARGLVDPTEHLFRLRLDGHRQNKDTWVSVNSTYPELITG